MAFASPGESVPEGASPVPEPEDALGVFAACASRSQSARRWVRPGTSRGRSYRKDIAAYQEQFRTWPSDRCLEVFRVRYSEVEDVRMLMSPLVPDAIYQVDGENLAVIGSGKDLANARELVHEIDQPLDQVFLDYRLVEWSEEGQRKAGVVWSDPALTEARMEYVLSAPLSKRPTAGPSEIKLGSFTGSCYVAPAEPSVVVPLVKGTIRLPRQHARKRR